MRFALTFEEQLSSIGNNLEGVDMVMYLLPSGAVSPVTKASPSRLWWRRRAAILPRLKVAEAEPIGNTEDRNCDGGESLRGAQKKSPLHLEDMPGRCGSSGTATWSAAQIMSPSRCESHLA
jgi:hypothetical protein